jgi:hypothetical protein
MQGIFGERSFFFKAGSLSPASRLAYIAPHISMIHLHLEGVIAYFYFPSIKGNVNYEDYDDTYTDMETRSGKDVLIF